MRNAARINRHPRRFDTIREIFSHDSYKKGPYMLRGFSSKMNVPRKTAVELILQTASYIARRKQLH